DRVGIRISAEFHDCGDVEAELHRIELHRESRDDALIAHSGDAISRCWARQSDRSRDIGGRTAPIDLEYREDLAVDRVEVLRAPRFRLCARAHPIAPSNALLPPLNHACRHGARQMAICEPANRLWRRRNPQEKL